MDLAAVDKTNRVKEGEADPGNDAPTNGKRLGNFTQISDKVVEVILSTLRGKLAKAGAPDVIETRRGFGYVIP